MYFNPYNKKRVCPKDTLSYIYWFVAIVFADKIVEMIAIQKRDQLRENVFFFVHMRQILDVAKLRFQIL